MTDWDIVRSKRMASTEIASEDQQGNWPAGAAANAISISAAVENTWIALALLVVVARIWLIPGRRIERGISNGLIKTD